MRRDVELADRTPEGVKPTSWRWFSAISAFLVLLADAEAGEDGVEDRFADVDPLQLAGRSIGGAQILGEIGRAHV